MKVFFFVFLTTLVTGCSTSAPVTSPSLLLNSNDLKVDPSISCSMEMKGTVTERIGKINTRVEADIHFDFVIDPYIDEWPDRPNSSGYSPMRNPSSLTVSVDGESATSRIRRISVHRNAGPVNDYVSLNGAPVNQSLGGWALHPNGGLSLTFSSAEANYLTNNEIPTTKPVWEGMSGALQVRAIMFDGRPRDGRVTIDSIEAFSCITNP